MAALLALNSICRNCSEFAWGRETIRDILTALKTLKKKRPTPFPAFQTGQVWRMENSDLHIGLIGKTLVHYKHYSGGVQRAPVSLTAKTSLEKYLIKHEAVLVKKAALAKA